MLLRRYGVVFREVLTRETILPKWREVLITLRRLEDRGEIRSGQIRQRLSGRTICAAGGRGILARPAQAAARRREIVSVPPPIPLNLVGIIVPGERVPAGSGKIITFRDGVAVPPARVLECFGDRGRPWSRIVGLKQSSTR